MIFMIY